MFLTKLKEQEKEAFLMLAHHVAHSDDEFCHKEEQIILGYSLEMSIIGDEYNKNSFNLQSTLKVFESEESKRIVLLELLALVHCDDVLHDKEQEILTAIKEVFNFSDGYYSLCSNWAKSILALNQQGFQLITL